VSQLLSWFASFWLEMVTLLEPIGNELQSWQDKQGLSRRISNWISANLTRRDDSNLPSGDCQRMAKSGASGDCVAASQLVRIALARDGHTA
jgi:hypothetical protein